MRDPLADRGATVAGELVPAVVRGRARGRPMSLALTGTAPLLRTTVKHDGRHYAPWIVLPTALSASSVLVYPFVFPTEQDRAGLAAAIGSNPALSLIFGPARD